MGKGFKGAPFGTQSSRFDISGIHPNRKLPGTFTQVGHASVDTKLGPGYYDIITTTSDFSDKTLEEKSSGPGWQRAYEVSRLAAIPHLLYKDQWELKREQKRKLGPGTYEYSDFLEVDDRKPRSGLGVLQTLEKRFNDGRKDEVPGPGSYGKGGVPHAVKEEVDLKRKSASTIGLLDNGGKSGRSLPATGCHLGPGTYEAQNYTEEMLKKMTSIRGPYDLFSGDRTKPIKTGHLAAPLGHNLGPGQYSYNTFVDDWKKSEKSLHGRFTKPPRTTRPPHERIYWFTLAQVPRDPNHQVGPGTYDPSNPTHGRTGNGVNQPGFLSSATRQDKQALAFFTKNFNPVGPGRYDIQRIDDSQHINDHKSVFVSKTGRLNHEQQKGLRERLRAKDIPDHDKFIVDHIPTEKAPSVNLDKVFKKQRALTIA